MTQRIFAHDNAGATLETDTPENNLWIEVKRADGVMVHVGSLFFDENPDGSLTVQWGGIRNETEWWEPCESVTIPAAELTPKEGTR